MPTASPAPPTGDDLAAQATIDRLKRENVTLKRCIERLKADTTRETAHRLEESQRVAAANARAQEARRMNRAPGVPAGEGPCGPGATARTYREAK